jgi:hypothetical protein
VNAGQAPGKLERRARVLLRAYPAGYRRTRGEEIITTLLEAAPPGRSFPPARDALSLLNGARHARAVRNRRLSARENLRLALLLALAIFAARAFYYPDYLGFARTGGLDVALATGIAAGLAPWVRHRVLRAACVIPAGALCVYASLPQLPWDGAGTEGRMAVFLVSLTALALWRGQGARLPGSWAGLVGVTPVLAAVPWLHLSWSDFNGSVDRYWYTVALLLVVAACWLATDARPAFGVIFALVLSYSLVVVTNLAGPGALFYTLTSASSLKWLASPIALCVVLTVAFARRVRRQARPAAPPTTLHRPDAAPPSLD